VGPGLAADGNVDGQIDNDDLSVWKTHFGQTAVPKRGKVGMAVHTIDENVEKCARFRKNERWKAPPVGLEPTTQRLTV
jgi:hypothetical protein